MSLQDSSEGAITGESTSHFRLKLEEFSFKSPQTSPLRRSARSCIPVNESSPRSGSPKTANESVASVSDTRKRTISSAIKKSSPKKIKTKPGYAPPETYAHLNCLTDCLGDYLDVLFCGINPGVHSATVGHHFAHPGNRFYKMLHGSGFTDRLVPPEQDATLPALYNVGITDIVHRPSSREGELSAAEMIDGVPTLLQKVAKYKPRFVCFIGKGMGQRVEKGLRREISKRETCRPRQNCEQSLAHGTARVKRVTEVRPVEDCGKTNSGVDSGIGLRRFKVVHSDSDSPVRETLFFVSHSSSGLATSMNLQKKTELLAELRELVAKHKDGTLDTSALEEVPVLEDMRSSLNNKCNSLPT